MRREKLLRGLWKNGDRLNSAELKRRADNREKFYPFKIVRDGVPLAQALDQKGAEKIAARFPGSVVVAPVLDAVRDVP